MSRNAAEVHHSVLHALSKDVINYVTIMVKTTQENEWVPTGQSLKNAPNTSTTEVYNPYWLVFLSLTYRNLTV